MKTYTKWYDVCVIGGGLCLSFFMSGAFGVGGLEPGGLLIGAAPFVVFMLAVGISKSNAVRVFTMGLFAVGLYFCCKEYYDAFSGPHRGGEMNVFALMGGPIKLAFFGILALFMAICDRVACFIRDRRGG